MKRLALQIGILLVVLVLEGAGRFAYTQQSESNPADQVKLQAGVNPPTSEQLLTATAISTLVSVADAARQWDDLSAAAGVEAQIADLLWEAAPETARSCLVKAWEISAKIEEPKKERSRFRNESAKMKARQQVLLVARKRAPSLARKWLDQMTDEAKQDKGTESRGAFDDRSERSAVLLLMAKASVTDNPQTAADLATASLDDGISFGLQEVLVAIQERDFQLAQGVFRAALSRLRMLGLSDPNELLILYAYLYTPGRILSANTSSNLLSGQVAVGRNQTHITAAAELNPALALEFLGLAADLLVSTPPPSTTANPELTARSEVSVINVILAKAAEPLPDKAAELQIKAHQIAIDAKYVNVTETPRNDLPTPRPEETGTEYAQRRIDALEALAERAPNRLSQDIAYARAALTTDVDHYQRGWKLANKIDDESLRDGVTNWISYRAALHFVEAKDFAKVYELSGKNTDLLQRAATLVVGAQRLIAIKDPTTAREWLDEARGLLKRIHDPDENAPRIALGIVTTYAQVDKWIALDTLSDAVKLMNQFPNLVYTDDRVPLVKRFSGFSTLPNFTYGTKGFSLETALDALPADQFDSTFQRLHEISSPEGRGLALMTLCRKYLQTVSTSHKKLS